MLKIKLPDIMYGLFVLQNRVTKFYLYFFRDTIFLLESGNSKYTDMCQKEQVVHVSCKSLAGALMQQHWCLEHTKAHFLITGIRPSSITYTADGSD